MRDSTVWDWGNKTMCACPPNFQYPHLGQIHSPGCPLNPSKRCSHCHGSGIEPLPTEEPEHG